MNDSQTSPIGREALNEFIRQLFACHWVMGQMINGMLERARSEEPDTDQDAYSMVRSAIGEVVDRHGDARIEAATKLIDEVMEAISDDSRIFPADQAVFRLSSGQHSGQPRVRRRRR
jgi:hypothetical protein